MLNLSPLFFTSNDDAPCLHHELDLTDAQRETIAQVRQDVRNCLKAGMPQVLRETGFQGAVPQPRFFTQGSWAYKTLNAPAHDNQQADVDDGCYLPLSFLAQTQRPSVGASVFFAAAEKALAPLLEKNPTWELVTDKPTCIRIVISDLAHIDIPLYAIPDDEFVKLTAALNARYPTMALDSAIAQAEHDHWDFMPVDQVLLAHRECDWKASDPRPVKKWFLAEVAAKTEQLRRVVRYLKAFRDWCWPTDGPSSILLMAAAAPLFERRPNRDDEALRDVVRKLPAALRAGVSNPVDSTESLTARLGAEKLEEVARAFERLGRVLVGAIDASDGGQACRWIRQEFGQRFPYAPNLARRIPVAAVIAATPAMAGPSELVGRMNSG